MNYSNVDTLINQIKIALKYFFSEQSKPKIWTDDVVIKYETSLATEQADCNMTYGWHHGFSRGNNINHQKQIYKGSSNSSSKKQHWHRTNPIDSTELQWHAIFENPLCLFLGTVRTRTRIGKNIILLINQCYLLVKNYLCCYVNQLIQQY